MKNENSPRQDCASVRAITSEDEREELRLQEEGRHRMWGLRGKARGIERSNQKLRYTLTSLSAVDLARLRGVITLELSTNQLQGARLNGAFGTIASLTTGRPVGQLANLFIHKLDATELLSGDAHGLMAVQGALGWWLPAGRPSTRQPPRRGGAEAILPRHHVWLPSSDLVLKLARLQVRERGLTQFPAPVFGSSQSIQADASAFLRHVRNEYALPIFLPQIESWLSRAISNITYGDPAAAYLITGRRCRLSTSTSRYTALSNEHVGELYQEAMTPFDVLPDNQAKAPPLLMKSRIGSSYCPNRQSIRKAQSRLRGALRPGKGNLPDPACTHNAMLAYTVLLIGMCTGFRPVKHPIPRSESVDEETGFLLIDDKKALDGYRTRVIWLPRMAREQLGFFDRHLEALCTFTDLPDHSKIKSLVGTYQGTGGLFMFDKDRRATPCQPGLIAELLHSHGWPHRPNAGRHYLRSHLLGRCPSETLHAFLGHWNRGVEPWSGASGLDPLAYRDSLASPLEQLLANEGWIAAEGLRPVRQQSAPRAQALAVAA